MFFATDAFQFTDEGAANERLLPLLAMRTY